MPTGSSGAKGYAAGVITYTGFAYVFEFKDHLGNIRLSYSDADDNAAIAVSEIIEENHYYPFGLKQKGYNNIVSGGNPMANNYKFGGKELNYEFDLKWYDISARNYDPAIARWMNPDPLAEQMRRHSPYNYGFDNPLRFTDPDGMAPVSSPTFGDFLSNGFSNQSNFDYDDPDKRIRRRKQEQEDKNSSESLAELSDNVYTVNQGDKVNGYEAILVSRDEETGYKSAIYEKNGNYVLAFAGSADKEDWETNYNAIAKGDAEQYRTAIKQATDIIEKYGMDNVEFTGHSLGGGLASAAALFTNGKATTFNAAGLSEDLKTNLGITTDNVANITAYVTRGEIVDHLQSNFLEIRAEGSIVELPARYFPNLVPASGSIKTSQRINRHMIGNLRKRLKKFNRE